jgi:hypothetical protein
MHGKQYFKTAVRYFEVIALGEEWRLFAFAAARTH